MSRLTLRQEGGLAKVVSILEELQVYHSFKRLIKNRSYLSGKEVGLQIRSRKYVLRRFLGAWRGKFNEIQHERDNIDKAKLHFVRHAMVKVKFLLYKWRKVIKEEQKWMERVLQSLLSTRCKHAIAAWKLMVLKRKG